MSEHIEAGYQIYVPTFGDKLRRFLGYRMHHGEEPPQLDPAKHVGWMKTGASFSFNFSDRLRLLLTGRLDVEITQHTTQQVDESVNSVSYAIRAPFERAA